MIGKRKVEKEIMRNNKYDTRREESVRRVRDKRKEEEIMNDKFGGRGD